MNKYHNIIATIVGTAIGFVIIFAVVFIKNHFPQKKDNTDYYSLGESHFNVDDMQEIKIAKQYYLKAAKNDFRAVTKCKLCQIIIKANEGDPQAQYDLAHNYNYTFVDGTINTNKAIEWYRKAAEQGHDQAQYQLGKLYFDGLYVDKDWSKAKKWLSKSAKQGNEDAQLCLDIINAPNPLLNPKEYKKYNEELEEKIKKRHSN